jgi:outer membrane protein
VREALLDLTAAAEQVAAARERLRLADQELAQARDRFRAGVASNADVITASFALTGSRNLVIDALTLYQSARVGLARAQGSITELP